MLTLGFKLSQSASETDRYLIIFPTYDIKNYELSFVISFIFDILRRKTTYSECHSMFFVVGNK